MDRRVKPGDDGGELGTGGTDFYGVMPGLDPRARRHRSTRDVMPGDNDGELGTDGADFSGVMPGDNGGERALARFPRARPTRGVMPGLDPGIHDEMQRGKQY